MINNFFLNSTDHQSGHAVVIINGDVCLMMYVLSMLLLNTHNIMRLND